MNIQRDGRVSRKKARQAILGSIVEMHHESLMDLCEKLLIDKMRHATNEEMADLYNEQYGTSVTVCKTEALTRCINCKQLPEIVEEADAPYRFLLRHKAEHTCAPAFKLESHQHTKEDCIRDWNRFNSTRR